MTPDEHMGEGEREMPAATGPDGEPGVADLLGAGGEAPAARNGGQNGAQNGGRRADLGHEGGLGVRDQIKRYRTAFLAVVSMILIAAASAGYILDHERLTLPTWVPVLGHEHFLLKGEFSTAQAVTPGQGQSVTIAGAKIGEIASVSLHEGRAIVTMEVKPSYARYIYRDATMLLRPKTQLQDITVEVSPGTPAAGRLHSGETVPLSQTTPNVNLDEFLASFDTETRDYVQLLLAGAAEGLHGNSRNLAAAFKRFSPFARDIAELSRELAKRHVYIARALHNFRLLVEALGSKNKALAELVDSANASLGAFAQQDHAVQTTLHELPGALRETNEGLGKLAGTARVAAPTLTALHPFAVALGPAQEEVQPALRKTTPILEHEVRPFAREIEPVVSEIQPDLQEVSEAFPKLVSTFTVLNEFFNELAYNPGSNQAGFLFYLNWFNHNLNSLFANADANGPIGNGLIYFACKQLFTLPGVAEVNPTARAVIGLLHPPAAVPGVGGVAGECPAQTGGGVSSASELAGRVFGKGLGSTFGVEEDGEGGGGTLTSLSGRSPLGGLAPQGRRASQGGRAARSGGAG
jgi:phospholipid/cholesterol/gamma-HCH transport system substrate-binding protein